MSAEPETVPCECTEQTHGGRPCVPIPKQHVRYDISIRPGGEEGIVRLCAHCFINGHLGMTEYRWRYKQKARATHGQAG